MTELDKKYLTPLAAHKLKFALPQIDQQCATFIEGFQQEEIVKALKQLGIEGKKEDQTLQFETPLGEIKVDFLKRLDGDYLGVAACFSFKNSKAADECFFVVFLNHQNPWMDSTGYQFKVDFGTDRPEWYEFAHLMQRVVAARLQIQDKALQAI